VAVEFLCETDSVAPGRLFRPKEFTGSKFGAVNVRGAHLAREDFLEREIEASASMEEAYPGSMSEWRPFSLTSS
jgi:hypothetical protein